MRFLAEFTDTILQCPKTDSQNFGGTLAVVVHVLEREFDVGFFGMREWLARLKHQTALAVGRFWRVQTGSHIEAGRRQVIEPDRADIRDDYGPLDHIAQFPYVAGPVVRTKQVKNFRIQTRNAGVVLLVQSLDHDLRNERNIFLSLAKRRKHDLENA